MMQPAFPVPDLPRIVLLVSHLQAPDGPSTLAQLAQEQLPAYMARAALEVIDVALADALPRALALERDGRADAFICTGATAAYLRQHVASPVLALRMGSRDLLRALERARQLAPRAAIMRYPHVSAELERMAPLFTVQLRQCSYVTLAEAQAAVRQLAADGVGAIIGSSLVVELAAQAGVHGVLALSGDAVREALDDALAICRSRRIEQSRRAQLDAVLHHLGDGVVALDRDGLVQSINPAMARLLGVAQQQALGRPLARLSGVAGLADLSDLAGLAGPAGLPGSIGSPGMPDAPGAPGFPGSSGRPGLTGLERGPGSQPDAQERVLRLGARTVVANAVPMHEHGQRSGTVITCQEIHAVQRAERHIRSASRPASHTARYRLEQIAGDSGALRAMVALARRYAAAGSTLLITGESGTGKELLAQGIHNAGPRRDGPFVPVNCAAFPETLLESELFGHEEGAFSGARKGGKIGLFEAGHGGTMFLDEIGDMPLPLQTRLLRVLQEREVQRLGATSATPIDVRVIAATHCDLRARIADGRFRADLFYRLNVLHLDVPPLRARRADIVPVARAILRRLAAPAPLDARHDILLAALQPYLLAYDWPGNVRELENALERALLSLPEAASGTAPGDSIDAAWLRGLMPEWAGPGLAGGGDGMAAAGAVGIGARAGAKGSVGVGAEAGSAIAAGTEAAATGTDWATARLGGGPHPGPASEPAPLRAASRAGDAAHIRAVLHACGGSVQQAAERLGVSRSTLWRRLRAAEGA